MTTRKGVGCVLLTLARLVASRVTRDCASFPGKSPEIVSISYHTITNLEETKERISARLSTARTPSS